jgi:hypothetical protein
MFLFLVSPLYSQIYTLQTKNLQLIYYDKEHAYVVPHLARCFENSLRFHRNLFAYTPSEEVMIFMHDFNDYGHGGTSTIPWNSISIGMEPFDYVYETQPANERMNWLMHHELAHVVATDKAASSDNFFRSLFFGKVPPVAEAPLSMFYSYLTTPRWYSPRWYHEGIAVFLETWMAGGLGRVLGGYDEMVFRTMVRDGSYFYDVVGLESEGTTIDFQVGQNAYLYGTRFVSYLAYHHGPEKLLKWFSRDDGSKRYFATQFKKAYGVSLDDEWSRWIEWEHQWQKTNLDSVRLYPTTPERPILQRALGSVSRAFYDSTSGKLYTAINYPGQLSHIAAIDIDNGTIKKICDVPTPALYYVASLAYDQSTGSLFFTTDNSRSWRDLNVVDVKTGKVRRLLKNNRTGDLAFNPADKSIWGVQHHKGISTVVKIPPPYQGWIDVLPLPYGKDIFNLDISPDGRFLTASLIEIDGRQRLIRMELANLLHGDNSYEVLYEFENNAPESFVYSPDGKYLFGTSYYTGVSNVFRYDFRNKKMEAITNAETGFFRPVPISDDSLVVFRYTGKGFVPVTVANAPREDVSAIKYLGQEIVERYPIVKEWIVGSPARIKIDSLTTYSGEYKGLGSLKLASAYPVVEGYKDFAAAGMRLNLLDPLGLHSIDFTASYTPNRRLPEKERLHLALNYKFWQWEISAMYNGADFYDLFGPTKTSRKGYGLGVKYGNFLLYEGPKTFEYTINVAGYGGLERLPEAQNIAASFDKLLNAGAKLDYKYFRRSLGAVEEEQGVRWQLIALGNYANKRIFPRIYSNLDYGFLLPLNHSSIWLRSSLGYSYSHGDREEPFANFFFGGFGNNWVDYQNAQRYREHYSFPGVELNAIGGTNYGKMTVEWTLPPLRFRRFGFPSLYLRWARLALFSTGIVTNMDSDQFRRTATNLGGQIDFHIVMFSTLSSTFSLGYAAAFEKDQRTAKEFMISLKIL